MGLNFNFNGTASWNDLLTGKPQENTPPPPQQIQQRIYNIIKKHNKLQHNKNLRLQKFQKNNFKE
jgi:hypothetical protein